MKVKHPCLKCGKPVIFIVESRRLKKDRYRLALTIYKCKCGFEWRVAGETLVSNLQDLGGVHKECPPGCLMVVNEWNPKKNTPT